MKRGQGLSMNAIIIAAIALLVLVVLIAIFSGRMGIFNRDLDDQTEDKVCEGKVVEATVGCEEGYYHAIGKFEDVRSGQICCVQE